MDSYENVIMLWEHHGPSSGLTREQYNEALKERDRVDNAAYYEAEAARKKFEEEQAAIAVQMQQEQTLMSNANGLASNSQADNASYINTGGGSTISSKLMIGDENIKRRKGGGTVSASLGL